MPQTAAFISVLVSGHRDRDKQKRNFRRLWILGFEKMVSIRAKKLRAAAAAAEAAPPIEHVEALPPLEKLQGIQEELGKVNAEAKAKTLEIEKKHMEMQKLIYRRRNEIISKIPDFWLTVFLKHPTLKRLLTEEDEEIFGYLDSLYVESFDDHRKGYHITLNFKANPYFSNEKLTKTIKFSGEGTLWSRGTTINWMAGKGPVDVGSDDKIGNKQPLLTDSFFRLFSSPEGDEVKMDQDWVANIIKEELWPNPMNCLDNADDSEDGD